MRSSVPAFAVTGAAPGAVPGWLKDPPFAPAFDLAFILGIALLACAMAGATVLSPALFWPMLTVHTWLFGYEHLVATYTRLIGHPADRARYRRLTGTTRPVGCVFGMWASLSAATALFHASAGGVAAASAAPPHAQPPPPISWAEVEPLGGVPGVDRRPDPYAVWRFQCSCVITSRPHPHRLRRP